MKYVATILLQENFNTCNCLKANPLRQDLLGISRRRGGTPAMGSIFYTFIPKGKEMIKGPIIIIDDDHDDQEIYGEAIKEIGLANEIHFFDRAPKFLEYIQTTEEQPFIILSDINMPEMTGLELKKKIDEDPYLKTKGIPFVFISTNASSTSVRHAHALSVQGYFEKPHDMEGIKVMLRTLFAYWGLCKHINNT
ncbi:response regulator [Paraflavisolibacter sp. H34]|uniref:response regulator n=1 Tax=Huijunlia imazamoxiresistens TaxID=3127457 RepID=UPI003019F5C0